jgi:broad specificity phosphatase PhoE
MRLYLVRHGETEYNRHDIFRGLKDIPLNDTGLRQARAAAECLKDMDFEAFYSGPLQRSYDTASAIAEPHGASVQLLSNLQDIDYGEWTGKTVDQVREAFPEIFQTWRNDPAQVTFPGGESLRDASARVQRGFEILAERHPDGNVLAVGHKMVNRLLLCTILGAAIGCMWHIEQMNGGINVIETGPRGYMLMQLNDTCHLTTCMTDNGVT